MTDAGWLDGLTEVIFPDGTDLLVDGEPTNRLYVLMSGTVRVHTDGLDLDMVDSPGTFLGEMAVLLGGAPRATVTTVGDCTLRFTEDAPALMNANPAVAVALAQRVARRLDVITGYLSDLRVQYAHRADHLAAVVTQVLQALMHVRPMEITPGSDREPEAPY